jgi:hypothetical protein
MGLNVKALMLEIDFVKWQELVILKPSVNYWTCFYRSFDDESHLIEDVNGWRKELS